MKILFFIESLYSGGKERRLVELIKGLRKYPDIECELVLTRKEIHYKDIFSTGIKIHYIVRKYLKKDPGLFYLFYKICKKYKPDFIHAWGNMVAIYAIPAKILLKIPLINNQIANAPLHVKGGLLSHKLIFPFSDLIIANSKAGLKAYNAPEKKSTVIYNGFNFDRIKNIINPFELKKEFNITTKYVIGMVASFTKLKDYSTYIKAANKVLIKNKDVTFLCIGAGNDKPYQELVVPENKNFVKFLGCKENVESIINICDIGVLSTYTEGISNSIVEFMALGKPIIATNGGGTKELVVNNITGYLIPEKSFANLTDKIITLIENPTKILEMGRAGKKRIMEEFTIDKMIKQFLKIYNEINY